jgi:hypothetical protein
MSELTAVISQFPTHERSIRRLYGSTPDFRLLCEDYSTALRAFETWRNDESRADEYRGLLVEIEVEILQALRNSTT